jgi:hypothetical protein
VYGTFFFLKLVYGTVSNRSGIPFQLVRELIKRWFLFTADAAGAAQGGIPRAGPLARGGFRVYCFVGFFFGFRQFYEESADFL